MIAFPKGFKAAQPQLACAAAPSCRVFRAPLPRGRALRLVPAAAQGAGPPPPERLDVDKTLKELGVDRPTARKVLQVWRQAVSTCGSG